MSVLRKDPDDNSNGLWFKSVIIGLLILLMIMTIFSPLTSAQSGGGIPIINNLNHQFEPVIYGNYIVWTDYRNDNGSGLNSDIFIYDLSTHQEYAICTDTWRQVRPDIYGTWVAWEDNRNGQNNWDIYAYDLTKGIEVRITENVFNNYKIKGYVSNREFLDSNEIEKLEDILKDGTLKENKATMHI